ncbi:hypothetical protein CALVIDRAFT_539848 [Calocera viscosa TUFC12733]|uniref:RTA1-domain-containing protein n=1 Tax=Calocera viscosa (strain TUFC12733) TaxID=1330018 RepID=A0A167JKF0_CALVF|nr:hypothetical protein CALVIDRAFT_539848 [Calocera viscosa TUFC12733]
MSSNSTMPSGFVEGSWWYYAPSKVAPIIFATLFMISGSWHLYQNIKYKCWRTTPLFPIAALIFAVGYVMREVAAFHYDNLSYYMASSIILLCSPPVYEAANVVLLGRFLYYVPYEAPLHPWRLMVTFGALQSALDPINANGAARATTPLAGSATQLSGRILLDVSLGLQLFSAIAFIAVALRFQYNCYRADVLPDKLRNSLRVLYVSCALISIRTIYRAVEWFETTDNNPSDPNSFPPVLRHEAYFYVFEATVMLLNSFLLNIWHPTRLLPQNYRVFLAPNGVTEMEGKGMLTKDPRSGWLKIVDPFDLYGLFTKRDQKINLWAEQTEVAGPSSTSGASASSSDGASDLEKQGWGNWQKEDDLVRLA